MIQVFGPQICEFPQSLYMCLVWLECAVQRGLCKVYRRGHSRQASGVSSGSLFWWRGVCKNAGMGVCKGMEIN